MKKTTFQYSIVEPCHEKWSEMTPIAQGRFCDSCAKAVVDFTTMTDRQVIQFMSTTTESVCGRMSADQLNRPFTQMEIGNNNSFSLRALVFGTAISTFSFNGLDAQVNPNSQTKTTTKTEKTVAKSTGKPEKANPVQTKDTLLSGFVFDNSNSKVIGSARVTIYDQEGNQLATTSSNEKGEFQVIIQSNQQPFKAVFKHQEYEDVTLNLANLNTYSSLKVGCNSSRTMAGMITSEKTSTSEQVKDTLFAGIVFDYKDYKVVGSASVTIYDQEGNQLTTTTSNERGEFQLIIQTNQLPFKAVFKHQKHSDVTLNFANLATYNKLRVGFNGERTLGNIITTPTKTTSTSEQPVKRRKFKYE